MLASTQPKQFDAVMYSLLQYIMVWIQTAHNSWQTPDCVHRRAVTSIQLQMEMIPIWNKHQGIIQCINHLSKLPLQLRTSVGSWKEWRKQEVGNQEIWAPTRSQQPLPFTESQHYMQTTPVHGPTETPFDFSGFHVTDKLTSLTKVPLPTTDPSLLTSQPLN